MKSKGKCNKTQVSLCLFLHQAV